LPDKAIAWLEVEIATPPFSREARLEAGFLLRKLQQGEWLAMPAMRPMPSIGRGCYELRVKDKDVDWRIVIRIDPDATVVGEIFEKKTSQTPKYVIDNAKRRFRHYDN
jgi:phage-related protein